MSNNNKKSISWILSFCAKLPDEQEQIKCLQANDNNAIRIILQYCFHPGAVWALPEGDPPYNPCESADLSNMLYNETKKLYLFLVGGNDNLKPLRRERLFIDILEAIDPADARLLLSIKNKTLPYDGLKPETIAKAYPGIF